MLNNSFARDCFKIQMANKKSTFQFAFGNFDLGISYFKEKLSDNHTN